MMTRNSAWKSSFMGVKVSDQKKMGVGEGLHTVGMSLRGQTIHMTME